MSADEQNTAIGIVAIVLIGVWIFLLVQAPVLVLFLTITAILVIGFCMDSGNGDGRNGRR